MQLFGDQADRLLASNLVEVVISHESELPKRTLREVDFRSLFNAGVVGIRRGKPPRFRNRAVKSINKQPNS
ncbi:TrkA C-terminal domain-containing protein [Oceanisphaera pacifica]|uniref:TrkA C-terminal domain-containing protein n=1 Tax=Oceanisphaera pacifica TaxID=2818389 RepID=UPI001FB19698|nr:TrkA C-terminal domain-containing protein [Oceanisphaera pacifica]